MAIVADPKTFQRAPETQTTDPFGNRIEYMCMNEISFIQKACTNGINCTICKLLCGLGDPANPQFLVTVTLHTMTALTHFPNTVPDSKLHYSTLYSRLRFHAR